ncbi:carbonic anhydrase 2 isoform X2 [Scaptodrosophila lebanonensis]|uniref:carbonic anhydrase n=1 Tax=Drosophila lebanonensis TaxID=7225 RepID=A0A6J2UB48_DROLE|nr:carbonic anhydrase 2 isoform X2 [Scaptodrosophila lebanonensis]
MKCSPANCVALTLLLTCGAVTAQDFGYEGQHGPEHWGEDYKRCSGKHQSPINIDVVNVVEKQFPTLEFINFDEKPKGIRLTNNGHTVLVKMDFEPGKTPRVRGGPLDARSANTDYQFEQFHFHWGANNTVGSEDLINNQSYPAELHVVMRSLQYKDFASALGQDHGVAVMAFFFRVKGNDNPNYNEFTHLLSSIATKDKSANFVAPLPLEKFLTSDLVNYYTYVGSLTTPPCSEEVVWIDFSNPIDISEDQIERFRHLTANDQHLMNNFRPIQPLNDRTVYQNLLPMTPYGEMPMSSIPFVDAANGVVEVTTSSAAFLHVDSATIAPP